MLLSLCQHIWKTQQWPQDWKPSVSISISKKDNAKECSNYHTIALISHASKVMLKILQARLQQYMNQEHASEQPGFRKGRGIRDQIANICWIMEKAREFQKSNCFCFTGLSHHGSDGKVPIMQETQFRSLGQEDPLEKEMATHSSTLA